jgi:hypothetical protein
LSDEQPTAEDHGAWIPFLIRKRRFAECVIVAWQAVEDLVGQMTVGEFELFLAPKKQDPRIDLLLGKIDFKDKLDFLKEMGLLSNNDVKTIREFSEERNRIFHGGVFTNPLVTTIREEEKTRIMELARKASQIAMNRGFGVWVAEEMDDMGNKDVPKPDSHPAHKRTDEIRRLFDKNQGVPNLDSEKKSEDVP